MSEYLEFLWEILDDLPMVIKKITEVQTALTEHKKSVIAANADIKGTDETVTTRSDQPSQSTPPKDESVDLEYCTDGVYRPKRERLDEK